MGTTISRTHTTRIAAIKSAATQCVVYSSDNHFNGHDLDPRHAWHALERTPTARLTEHPNGTWTIHLHENKWYELSTAPAPAPGPVAVAVADEAGGDTPVRLSVTAGHVAAGGIDPEVLKAVLAEQVGRHTAQAVFAELDTALTAAALDPALPCGCAERDEPREPDLMVCGACGRGWCHHCTPTPSGRCPFESEHRPDPDPEPSRLRWEAAGRSGPIPTAEDGTVTLLRDGDAFLGVDLATGQVLTWPDGETAHVIATFAPHPPVPHLSMVADRAEVIALRSDTTPPDPTPLP